MALYNQLEQQQERHEVCDVSKGLSIPSRWFWENNVCTETWKDTKYLWLPSSQHQTLSGQAQHLARH